MAPVYYTCHKNNCISMYLVFTMDNEGLGIKGSGNALIYMLQVCYKFINKYDARRGPSLSYPGFELQTEV